MSDRPTAAPRQRSPEELVARLVRLLDIEEVGPDRYRGHRWSTGRGRVFGGEVIGQAMAAATRSTPGLSLHSLHAYFLRPGNQEAPIEFDVVRDFDGARFANRRVTARQQDQAILTMSASFQRPEEGLSHQTDMPAVPPPEELMPEVDRYRRDEALLPERLVQWLTRSRPIEIRPTEEMPLTAVPRQARNASWFRAAAPIGDDPALHQAVLGYASDMMLLGTALLPHAVSWITHRIQTASLDHSLWIHEPFRADDWLLYVTDSPWSGHGRGYNRGQVFSREGRLVASVAQEGLIRMRE